MKKYKTFETERLIIQPTTELDAEFIFELLNSRKWLKYIGDRKIYSVNEAAEYIKKKMIPQLKKLGFSNYTVIRKSDNIKVGTCGLYDREGMEGIDIGFAFLPQYEKRGYAYESVNKLKEVAIAHFKMTEIKAITMKENISSQKLLEKIGLQFNEMIKLENNEEELMLFSLKIGIS
ncbi:MAG: ribosomal-protein-alanine N-acetyltransferase [Maribacter sp.]|jgi:ribosomal-protein-alanine N-acetyltransferase